MMGSVRFKAEIKNFMYTITAGKHKQNNNCHITVSSYKRYTYTHGHATLETVSVNMRTFY